MPPYKSIKDIFYLRIGRMANSCRKVCITETRPAGAEDIFWLQVKKRAWVLRAAVTSPDRSLEFYAAQ